MLRDLRRNLDRELDFRLEAENAARLMKSLGGRKGITVPRVVPEVGLRCFAVLSRTTKCELPQVLLWGSMPGLDLQRAGQKATRRAQGHTCNDLGC